MRIIIWVAQSFGARRHMGLRPVMDEDEDADKDEMEAGSLPIEYARECRW